MKKLLLAVVLLYGGLAMGQLPAVPKINAGTLLTQLVNGIRPSSFQSTFSAEKESWLTKAVKTTDIPGLAKNISSFESFIKPSMFKQAFSLKNLQQLATTAKTASDAAGLLKNLEGGLKPEAMTDAWASRRPEWTNALNLLK